MALVAKPGYRRVFSPLTILSRELADKTSQTRTDMVKRNPVPVPEVLSVLERCDDSEGGADEAALTRTGGYIIRVSSLCG